MLNFEWTNSIFQSTDFNEIQTGIIGKELNTIDYELPKDEVRRQEKKIITSATSLPPNRQIFLDQVHGIDVLDVVSIPQDDSLYNASADASVTTLTNIALVIRTADCVPVIMYDPAKKIIGAVHSGWKGTRGNITGETIHKMVKQYGSNPADLQLAILPAISSRSYNVGEEFTNYFPEKYFARNSSKLFLDLTSFIYDSAIASALDSENIYRSTYCTLIDNDKFFSHRCGDKGRNLTYIMLNKN